MNTFKAAFREIYSSLELKLNQHFNNPQSGNAITKKNTDTFRHNFLYK